MKIDPAHKIWLIVIIMAITSPSYADWSTDPATNDITVTHGSGNRYPTPVTDGEGGMVTVWRDDRNSATTGYDLYMQRLAGDGTEMWTSGGLSLVAQTGTQAYPYVLQESSGGALIFWIDYRSGSADIYAQKVDSDGVKQWASSGVAVASGSGNQQYYGDGYWFEDFIIEDGSGGAFLTYYDDSDGDKDVYVQHINSSGSKLWGSSGSKVTNNTNNDQHARIVSDESGGLVVIWENYNTGTGANVIYGQRVNSSGVVQWTPSDGVDLVPSPAYPYKPADPEVVPDGSGGAIFLFNTRGGLSTGDLYMQRVNASGTIQWGNSGAVMSNQSSTEIYYDITPDGSGGFYAMWSDFRSMDYDVYAQKIDVDGNMQWTSTGLLIHPGSTSNNQITGDMLVDGDGNLIIAYTDNANSATTGQDISAQKIDSDGNLLWGTSGKVVTNATGNQGYPRLVPTYVTSDDGFIAVWEDYRNGNYDLFASFVNIDGSLGGPGAEAPLPVKFISFEGRENMNKVDLNWATVWELNNDYYQVERSRDGINYEVVGYVQGKGEGEFNGKSDYRFTDQMPYFGVNYYRLKQVDFDGQFEYSDVIMVNYGREALISVYPNPTKENLRFLSEEVVKAVDIYSITGVKVLSKSFSQGVEAEIRVKELKPGKYIVQFSTDSDLYTRHFVKH